MYQISNEKFGLFVTELRKEKNLTQKDLAEKLYVSDKTVSKWERGLSMPNVVLLIPIADRLCRLLVTCKAQVCGGIESPAESSTEKCERDCSLRSSQPDRSNLSSGQPDGGTACKSQKDVPSGQYQTSCRGLLCMGKRDPD